MTDEAGALATARRDGSGAGLTAACCLVLIRSMGATRVAVTSLAAEPHTRGATMAVAALALLLPPPPPSEAQI
jgi:hypothetical protein